MLNCLSTLRTCIGVLPDYHNERAPCLTRICIDLNNITNFFVGNGMFTFVTSQFLIRRMEAGLS